MDKKLASQIFLVKVLVVAYLVGFTVDPGWIPVVVIALILNSKVKEFRDHKKENKIEKPSLWTRFKNSFIFRLFISLLSLVKERFASKSNAALSDEEMFALNLIIHGATPDEFCLPAPFTESGGVVICLSDNSHIIEIEASCSTGNDVSPLAQNQTFNF
jgi:hypothetical protein